MKKLLIITLIFICSILILGCQRDADVASHNLSYAADNFELDRRIVFYNGITGDYMLVINGRCSVKKTNDILSVTCKIGKEKFVKHYLGLSDNVTYFSEQVKTVNVSTYNYKVVFKPQSILPDIDFKGSVSDITESLLPDDKD